MTTGLQRSESSLLTDVEKYTKLGNLELKRGNVARAYEAYEFAYKRALTIKSQSGKKYLSAEETRKEGSRPVDILQLIRGCSFNLGAVLIGMEKPKQGLEYLHQAQLNTIDDWSPQDNNESSLHPRKLSSETTVATADLYYNFGLAYKAMGFDYYNIASNYFTIALDIYKKIKLHSTREGETLLQLGELKLHEEDTSEEACELFSSAARCFRKAGLNYMEVLSQTRLAHALMQCGADGEEVKRALSKPLAILDYLDKTIQTVELLRDMGRLFLRLKQEKSALDMYTRGMHVISWTKLKKSSETLLHGELLQSTGSVLNSLGKWPEALKYLEQAVTIFHSIPSLEKEAECHCAAGYALSRLGNSAGAAAAFHKCIGTCRSVSSPQRADHLYTEALALEGLSAVAFANAQLDKTVQHLRRAISILPNTKHSSQLRIRLESKLIEAVGCQTANQSENQWTTDNVSCKQSRTSPNCLTERENEIYTKRVFDNSKLPQGLQMDDSLNANNQSRLSDFDYQGGANEPVSLSQGYEQKLGQTASQQRPVPEENTRMSVEDVLRATTFPTALPPTVDLPNGELKTPEIIEEQIQEVSFDAAEDKSDKCGGVAGLMSRPCADNPEVLVTQPSRSSLDTMQSWDNNQLAALMSASTLTGTIKTERSITPPTLSWDDKPVATDLTSSSTLTGTIRTERSLSLTLDSTLTIEESKVLEAGGNRQLLCQSDCSLAAAKGGEGEGKRRKDKKKKQKRKKGKHGEPVVEGVKPIALGLYVDGVSESLEPAWSSASSSSSSGSQSSHSSNSSSEASASEDDEKVGTQELLEAYRTTMMDEDADELDPNSSKRLSMDSQHTTTASTTPSVETDSDSQHRSQQPAERSQQKNYGSKANMFFAAPSDNGAPHSSEGRVGGVVEDRQEESQEVQSGQ